MIADLKEGMRRVVLEAEVVGIEPAPAVEKEGRRLECAHALLRDDTGTIWLVVWGPSVKKLREGAWVRVTDCYIKTFKGRLVATLGRYGAFEVVR